MREFILASQSPRRKQLLEWAEIPFRIIVSDALEQYPTHLKPEEVPEYIAREKAGLVLQKALPHDVVIAADTVVVLDGEIIGKPANREEGIAILSRLSGRKHRVITGVVIGNSQRNVSFNDITEVEFHTLSSSQISFYIDKYQPYDKAGAYAIQEWIGVVGIKQIKGDFYNVMGLPVSRVVAELENWKG